MGRQRGEGWGGDPSFRSIMTSAPTPVSLGLISAPVPERRPPPNTPISKPHHWLGYHRCPQSRVPSPHPLPVPSFSRSLKLNSWCRVPSFLALRPVFMVRPHLPCVLLRNTRPLCCRPPDQGPHVHPTQPSGGPVTFTPTPAPSPPLPRRHLQCLPVRRQHLDATTSDKMFQTKLPGAPGRCAAGRQPRLGDTGTPTRRVRADARLSFGCVPECLCDLSRLPFPDVENRANLVPPTIITMM